MKQKFRSKKGITLVEMVVTIAVLSIVSGLGIGIFAMTLNHYTTAARVETQQEEANLVEEQIVQAARVAKEVYFLPDDTGSLGDGKAADAYPRDKLPGEYFVQDKGEHAIRRFRYAKDSDESSAALEKSYGLAFEHVKQISFKIVKKTMKTPGSKENDFLYLDYVIEMDEGYALNGSVVLENVGTKGPTAAKLTLGGGTGVIESSTYVLKRVDPDSSVVPTSNAGVIFEREKY
ncbi:MAG: type II secretion system protein [Clostridia bacterium]|nr:type II secretion system protein [Clostridia bacterium]